MSNGEGHDYSRIRNYVRGREGACKSFLNNELTSRLTREFFVRGDFGNVEGVCDAMHLHEARVITSRLSIFLSLKFLGVIVRF